MHAHQALGGAVALVTAAGLLAGCSGGSDTTVAAGATTSVVATTSAAASAETTTSASAAATASSSARSTSTPAKVKVTAQTPDKKADVAPATSQRCTGVYAKITMKVVGPNATNSELTETTLTLRNTGHTSCTLTGYPKVGLKGTGTLPGTVVPQHKTSYKTITVVPGGTAVAHLQYISPVEDEGNMAATDIMIVTLPGDGDGIDATWTGPDALNFDDNGKVLAEVYPFTKS